MHARICKWLAERIKDCWRCPVEQEQDVAPPLVKSSGRMDIVVRKNGQKLLIDVVVVPSEQPKLASLRGMARQFWQQLSRTLGALAVASCAY